MNLDRRPETRDRRPFVKKVCCNLLIWLVLSASAFAGDYDLYLKSGNRSASWDGMVKAGLDSFDTGDHQSGVVFLQKAYNMGCRDGIVVFKLGLFFETTKNYKEAEKYFKDALVKLPEQYPDYPETKRMHEHLARLYYQTNQFDKAMPELIEALKITPDNFMLLFMSAQILRINKNYSQAIAAFEKALTVPIPTDLKPDPKKTVYSELMTLYFETKDYQNCLKYAEMILAIQPNDAAALSYRRQIQTLEYKKREQEAIKKMVE